MGDDLRAFTPPPKKGKQPIQQFPSQWMETSAEQENVQLLILCLMFVHLMSTTESI